MSHIVTIHTEVRDVRAVQAACRRLAWPEPSHGTVQMFSGTATGLVVRLPGWQYPVVCDTAAGQVRFDNFSGRWGDQKHLDRFLQTYAVEKARLEARARGHRMTERDLADGSIQLTIHVGA